MQSLKVGLVTQAYQIMDNGPFWKEYFCGSVPPCMFVAGRQYVLKSLSSSLVLYLVNTWVVRNTSTDICEDCNYNT